MSFPRHVSATALADKYPRTSNATLGDSFIAPNLARSDGSSGTGIVVGGLVLLGVALALSRRGDRRPRWR